MPDNRKRLLTIRAYLVLKYRVFQHLLTDVAGRCENLTKIEEEGRGADLREERQTREPALRGRSELHISQTEQGGCSASSDGSDPPQPLARRARKCLSRSAAQPLAARRREIIAETDIEAAVA